MINNTLASDKMISITPPYRHKILIINPLQNFSFKTMNKLTNLKALLLFAFFALFLLQPASLNAQSDGFFRGGNDNYEDRTSGIDINDEGEINNYGIGETVPLGSGLLILTAVGAGYAVLRRKKGTKLFLALALLLGMTQCKKNAETISNPAVVEGVHITLDVCGDDGSKVVVTPGYENPVTHETYANVEYENGDKIYVGYNNAYVGELTFNGTTFEGDVSIAAPVGEQPLHFYLLGGKGFTPTIDDNIATVVISDQSEQYPVISYYHSNEPYTGSGAYTSKLRNKCSIMKFNVVTESTSPICIMGMNNKVTVDFTTPNGTDNGFSYSKDGAGEIKMTAGGGTAENPAVKWAIVLPQDALSAGNNEAYTAISGSNPYMTGNRPAIPVIHSNEYHSDATDRTITVDKTPKFTIGDKQVEFAPGNLMATTEDGWTTWSWSFMEHQYSTIETDGDINANRLGETAISLFKWAANGTGDGEKPNKCDAENSHVREDLTLENNTDWGHCIGGGNTWRTPSDDEWNYVLNRIVAINKSSWGVASVNNVNGLLLLPDNWNGALDSDFVYGNESGLINTYSESTTPKWSEMEAAGVVFLPACGYVEHEDTGSYITGFGVSGCYWASTYADMYQGNTESYSLFFSISGKEAYTYSDHTHYNSSVRLIRDIE